MAYTERRPAGDGTFFRFQVYERVGMSLVQAYERLLGYHNGKKNEYVSQKG